MSQLYDDAAPGYEELWGPELLELSRAILDEVPLADAATIREVGSGVGAFLRDLGDAAPTALVVGTDLAPGMLARADAAAHRVASDASMLPFKDGTFDVAVAAFVLFHLFDPPQGMAEEEFIAHRTGHGASRYRFAALPPEARERCLERVRSRLAPLGPREFEQVDEVVYAIGRKTP